MFPQPPPSANGRARLAGFGWAMFEFARNPYYFLVVVYVFAPYLAAEFAGGGAEGQAKMAGIVKTAGMACAVTGPLLGYALDRGAPRKLLAGLFLGVLAASSAGLWIAAPGEGAPPFWVVGALLAAGYCSYTWSEVVHNAMLADVGGRRTLGPVSGLGQSLGQASSLILLVFVLWGLLLPAQGMDWPFVPDAPVFGLDPAQAEPQRFVGPLVAGFLLAFIWPFFMFAAEGRNRVRTTSFAVKHSAGGLGSWFGGLKAHVVALAREHPEALKYLFARMLFADAVVVLATLGGVYMRTFLGWTGVEMLLYAVFGTVFSLFGGVLGGWLDARIGPKRALVVELSIVITVMVLQLSVTPDAILFGLIPAGHNPFGWPVFSSVADLVYLAMIGVISTALIAVVSSSRHMMTAVAPRERVGEFFGLYGLAGTATSFIGPMMVEAISRATGDQRLAMASNLLLMGGGLVALLAVRAPVPIRDENRPSA